MTTTDKKRITVAASELRPGDFIATDHGGVTVAGVDSFGCMVIVDFTDGTATGPVRNGMVSIEREVLA